tara:strand:+ start:514 stop:759 length:246 start_codon:yes stop_codon:yes gene_type:complete
LSPTPFYVVSFATTTKTTKRTENSAPSLRTRRKKKKKTPPTDDDDDEDFEPTSDFGRRKIAPKSVDSSYFQQTVVVLLWKS